MNGDEGNCLNALWAVALVALVIFPCNFKFLLVEVPLTKERWPCPYNKVRLAKGLT